MPSGVFIIIEIVLEAHACGCSSPVIQDRFDIVPLCVLFGK